MFVKLEIKRLVKNYGKKRALKGIDMTLTEGVYGFLVPNGAGKSTFMNSLTGNLKATSGQILYDGEDVTKMGREFRGILGYMPQQQALYPNFTAEGSFTGSALYTPSTFFASSITSAPISAARSTAAVSVEKNGLPLPPPKRTTLPFSR